MQNKTYSNINVLVHFGVVPLVGLVHFIETDVFGGKDRRDLKGVATRKLERKKDAKFLVDKFGNDRDVLQEI